jgi:hypothetical protein
LQKKIDDIKNAPLAALNMTAEGMAGVLDILELTDPVEEMFAERFVEAEVALKASIAQLNSMIGGKRASEELARQQEALRIENEAKAKAEAEAKAAEEVKQRAAQEAEALRLKAENEAIEKARAEFQREKAEFGAEKAARAEEESKARAKAEAEAQAVIAKAAAEQQAALSAERAKMEAEARAKAQADSVAQRAAIEADRVAQKPLDDLEQEMLAKQEAQISELKKCDVLADSLVSRISDSPTPRELISAIAAAFNVDNKKAVYWITTNFYKTMRDENGNRSIFDDVDE